MNTKINRVNADGTIETVSWYTNEETVKENAALYLAHLHNFHNWWDNRVMDRFRQQIKLSIHNIAIFEYNGITYTAMQ